MRSKWMAVVAALALWGVAVGARADIAWSFYTTSSATDASWVPPLMTPVNVVAVNFGATGLADTSYGVPGGESWAWKAPNSSGSTFYRYSDGSSSVSFTAAANQLGAYDGFSSGDDSLLANGLYSNWGQNGTVNLENMLVIGQTYTVQLVFADKRSPGRTISLDAGATWQQYGFSSGQYLVAAATFTADSTSLSVTPLISSNQGSQINAVRVSAVIPEPATFGLFGVAAVAMLLRKRLHG